MFYGAGAGGVQTASAVLGDLVSDAKRHVAGGQMADGIAGGNGAAVTEVTTELHGQILATDECAISGQIARFRFDVELRYKRFLHAPIGQRDRFLDQPHNVAGELRDLRIA